MIVALDEIPRAAEPCDPSLDWRPVRDHLGIGAFGVNAFLGAAAGEREHVVVGRGGLGDRPDQNSDPAAFIDSVSSAGMAK